MAKIRRGLSNMNDRIGEINHNTFGSTMVIKEYRNNRDVDVFFPKYDYTKEHVQYKQFIKGEIKCPYEKRVYNIGYLGEGRYNASINGKLTKCYKIWNGMLKRCYYPKVIEKRPTYEGGHVHESWHNFQTFSEWVDENYYEIEGQRTELDKDILCKGNKIYSPSTCVFVPQTINTLFTKRDNCRGDSPIGVVYNKSNKNYRSLCCVNGKTKHLGCFDTKEEAFEVYKNFKEQYIKEVADQYKDKIPSKLYNAMMSYEIDIND